MLADVHTSTEIAVLIAAVGYMAKTIYALAIARRNGHGRNGTSGEKTVDFWKDEIRTTIADNTRQNLEPFLENQTRILKEIREGQIETNRGVTELITVMRERGGRR